MDSYKCNRRTADEWAELEKSLIAPCDIFGSAVAAITDGADEVNIDADWTDLQALNNTTIFVGSRTKTIEVDTVHSLNAPTAQQYPRMGVLILKDSQEVQLTINSHAVSLCLSLPLRKTASLTRRRISGQLSQEEMAA